MNSSEEKLGKLREINTKKSGFMLVLKLIVCYIHNNLCILVSAHQTKASAAAFGGRGGYVLSHTPSFCKVYKGKSVKRLRCMSHPTFKSINLLPQFRQQVLFRES